MRIFPHPRNYSIQDLTIRSEVLRKCKLGWRDRFISWHFLGWFSDEFQEIRTRFCFLMRTARRAVPNGTNLQIQPLDAFQHVVGGLLQLAKLVGSQFQLDDFLDAVLAEDGGDADEHVFDAVLAHAPRRTR